MVRFSTLLSLLLAMLILAPEALALPRYSAQYGQNCTLCHVNPTGGGMRTEYAAQYLVPEEIAATGWTEEEAELLTPRIAPGITVGVDLRSLLYQQEGGGGSVLAMQGDLYLNLMLGGRFNATVEHGINGAGEIFGTARFETLDGYLKAGRFYPDHGWRFADHQMFNRRYLADGAGSDAPTAFLGQGLELGISPGGFSASASLLGASRRNGDNYTARALYQKGLGDLNVGAGASLWRRQLTTGHRRAAGIFGYASLGPLTWLGEWDETSEGGVLGNLMAHELTFTVRRGYDLRATYNFHDPDRALESGARHRYGGGLSAMPRPYFGYSVMANYWNVDEGSAVPDTDRLEGEVMIHFFY